MKIIFFGSPEFACTSLEVLDKTSDFEILAVVTQPDKKVGRKQTLTPPPVKELALKLGIKVLQPASVKSLENQLSKFNADMFIVIAYGMILNKNVLDMPKFGSINVHASLLPKYRGASPIQEALLNGDNQTGISIMKMDEKLDHGPIYMMQRVDIAKTDNYESLSKKLAFQSALILPYVLEDIFYKRVAAIPQIHNKASYCKKITKLNGEIKRDHTAEKIINMIKAYTPWPGVYMNFNNKKLKILEAEISNKKIPTGELKIIDKELHLGCKNESIKILSLQPEGKNVMNDKTFMNGYGKLINK